MLTLNTMTLFPAIKNYLEMIDREALTSQRELLRRKSIVPTPAAREIA